MVATGTPGSWIVAATALIVAGCAASGGASSPVPPPPPPPPPPSASPLLFTTLDGPTAVSVPAFGSGAGATVSTSPANDFVPGRNSNGLNLDAVDEQLLYPQVSGSVQHVELDRGTMEFWYRPAYDHDDDLKYRIAGTGAWNAPGSLHIGKHNSSNQNAIYIIYHDAVGTRVEHDVEVPDYSWSAGDWVLIRLTWDFTVGAGERNLHLYLDGVEVTLTGEVTFGPQGIPSESSSQFVSLGVAETGGSLEPRGVYDDLKIWNQAIPPS